MELLKFEVWRIPNVRNAPEADIAFRTFRRLPKKYNKMRCYQETPEGFTESEI